MYNKDKVRLLHNLMVMYTTLNMVKAMLKDIALHNPDYLIRLRADTAVHSLHSTMQEINNVIVTTDERENGDYQHN